MTDPGDLDDDLPPLVGEDGEELSDDGDDMPPLVGEDGEALPDDDADDMPPLLGGDSGAAAADVSPAGGAAQGAAEAASDDGDRDGIDDIDGISFAARAGVTEEELASVEALRAAARQKGGYEAAEAPSAADAMKELLKQSEEPRAAGAREPDEKTMRMITAISKDDFEECEDAIMQGADVNVDCGAGMRALHISALRGEMFLTELLIAHGANVNQRDMSGNTPLLYTCHFWRQHGRGVQLVAQLLYHKADPFYTVKDGKLAGKSAFDLMEKACREPATDESVPRQMRAMIQLMMDGKESGVEAITKMWMSFKSQNKKLYQVSSKKDNYDYVMKNIAWSTPEDAKNAQAYTPVKMGETSEAIVEEKFTNLQNYSFTDEGEKVKIYVEFPERAKGALEDKGALQVDYDFQAFDLKLRSAGENFRLRIDPLHGSIEGGQCKHRVSSGSCRVTLTLVKRHKNRGWPAIQKPR